MTRAELRQYVRDLSLVLSHEASDDLLDRFLDEGYKKTVHRRNWSWLLRAPEILRVSTWPFNINQAFGVTPVLAINDLVETARHGLPLTQITRSEASFFFNGPISSIHPKVYWIEEGLLYVLPKTENIEIAVSYFADTGWGAGSTAVPPFPEAFHEAILANFALSRLWERQEDFERAMLYLDRYDQGIGEMIFFENTRTEDRPKIYSEFAGIGTKHPNMPWLDGITSGGETPVPPAEINLHVVSPTEPERHDGLVWVQSET